MLTEVHTGVGCYPPQRRLRDSERREFKLDRLDGAGLEALRGDRGVCRLAPLFYGRVLLARRRRGTVSGPDRLWDFPGWGDGCVADRRAALSALPGPAGLDDCC